MTSVSAAIKSSFIKKEDLVFTFFIDKNFPAFEGHFPGAPLLPGIVQIEIALFCIRQAESRNVSVSEIKKSKFVKPILPDTEIAVSVSRNDGYYGIVIKDGKDTYSQISMCVS